MSDELVSITTLDEHRGVLVHDRVDDARFEIRTDRSVEPRPVPPDEFRFPVDEAVSIEAEELVAPQGVVVYARSLDEGSETQVWREDGGQLEAGRHELQVMSVTPKVYLRVSGPMTVPEDDNRMRFQFGERREVEIGARTCHEQPAGTVQTTDDPHDVARAVSTFGSALKTLSPERSFPTLRGHPPLVEVGAELSVPDVVSPPDSGVVVEVPPDLASLYRVAPLAFYFGATVECGTEPRVVADGESLPLSTDRLSVEERIDRLLQQSFLLDCIVRTEGLYQMELEARTALEESLPFDLESMYDAPLSQRVAAYDDVPYHLVEPHVPQWPVRSTITPNPEHLGYLPFIAYWLSSVHVAEHLEPSSLPSPPPELTDFVREVPVRGGSEEMATESSTNSDVESATSEALAQMWIGEGVQAGAMKPRLERVREIATGDTATNDVISVAVVCTDREMLDETRDGIYGLRDVVDFDVSTHYCTSIAELRELLERDIDFFHYVGHIDDDGFQCPDGHLDAASLEYTGVEAFLLNACRSYDQGRALVDAGAKGGIVTLQKVFNHRATSFGRQAARFLNQGYSLEATLSLLDHVSLPTDKYTVVGAPRYSVCQTKGGANVAGVLDRTGEQYELAHVQHPANAFDIGSVVNFSEMGASEHHIASGEVTSWTLSPDEVTPFLESMSDPVAFDGEFHWPDDFPDL
ncbi:hypothetical protein [Salinirubrum litoreum]|uniref:CHAT domain-containing protein n=1 Tax=Salinirubrum litoreum TaxID=1126234 RepID=A0ABD5RDN2_9EURY|nr:hypothetical protein [Salinirubrum litoreum]